MDIVAHSALHDRSSTTKLTLLYLPVAPPSSFSNLPEWPQPRSTVRKDEELVHVCLQIARYL